MQKKLSFAIFSLIVIASNINLAQAQEFISEENETGYGYKKKILQTTNPFLNKFYDIKTESFKEGSEVTEKEKEKMTLKDAGYNFSEQDYIKAIENGDVVNIMSFIYAGMPVDVLKEHSQSTLYYAAKANQEDAFKLLLSKGANISYTNRKYQNLIMVAIEENLQTGISLLVKYGIDLTYIDHDSWSALHYAIYNKDIRTAFLLIKEAPVLLKYKNNMGNTPLLLALERGYQDKDKELITFAKILVKKEEFINTSNITGNTALHYAVMLDSYPFAKIILELGANPNLRNLKGWRPIDVALENKNVDLANLLRYYGAKL